ncbi:Bifunctional hemolysin/adenylate cyclase precursor [Roseivivax jejudonensis]|uniref:Bifunctional hemolysin/adenylate cyclase n=1 Tax=Roseivivax jejudonensis TaxID=1529041 RepID=A0A1X6ZBF6_9RHOB|nr:Calx-beta domain-containing protein [Roseivivax jejudonensis]SLN46083.1 Bifunctional hemolysin/adenylate cyclase precursor [Roseivivax jejudonensis]
MPDISIAPSPADESIGSGFGGTLEWVVELSETALDTVLVPYRLFSGTGLVGIDIRGEEGVLVFAPGDTSQTLGIRADSDNDVETDESVVVEFFDPVGADLPGGVRSLRVTNFILDDDGSDVDRALYVSSPTIVEGDGGTREALFDVSISEAYGSLTTFSYATVNGTARAGSDYTASSGTVTFLPGQTSTEVRVDVSGDTQREPSETFALVVDTDSSVADGGIGATGVGTILDDDAPGGRPTLSLTATGAPESIGSGFGGTVTFVVRLSEPSFDAVSVGYRTLEGTAEQHIDYPFTDGTLTFAPGETWKTVTVRVDSDNIDEADESFSLELFDAAGADFAGGAKVLRAGAFILDDDGVGLDRGLHVSSPVLLEGDGGTQRAIFEVTLSRPATTELSFDYETQDAGARAGSDFTGTSGTVTFAPGQTSATVEVLVSGDTAREPTESFQLVVNPSTAIADGGAGAVGEATILDDDGGALPVLSSAPALVRESVGSGFGGTLDFTLTLSEPSLDAVTVGYRTLPATATSQIDYPREIGTVTFAPGETSKSLEIRVDSDNDIEDDEAFFVEYFDVTGATFAGGAKVLRETGFILEDDDPGLSRSLQVSEPVLVEGDGGSRTARFELTLSRPVASEQTFDWATHNGSATAGSDYTGASGSVTFAPGQLRAYVDVSVRGDTRAEASEFFLLSVTPNGTLGDGGAGATGRALILDDDGAAGLPTLTIQSRDAQESVGSGFGGWADFVVTLSEPSLDTVTVQYRSAGRTATEDTDFPDTSGTLTFAPGETSKTISPRVRSDNENEADESFEIELFSPSGAVLAGGVPVLEEAAFILDDDAVGLDRAIHVSDVVVTEPLSGTATATFEVRLSRPFDTNTTIGYATSNISASAGSDYTATSGTLTFRPGQTEAAVNVTIRSDGNAGEGTETFVLGLSSLPPTLTGGTAGAIGVGTIRQPQIQLPPTGDIEILGDARAGQTLSLDLSGFDDPNGLGPLSIQWRRDGSDIGSATGDTYTLVPADIGAVVSVRVSYTDGLGAAESVIESAGRVLPAAATNGADSIVGGPRDDLIDGLGGNDRIDGAGGDDTLLGGNGNDLLRGGAGNDALFGQNGNDTMLGQAGNDTMGGSDGNDSVDGGDGNDSLGGGAGNDTLLGGNGDDTIGGGLDDDRIDGGIGDDVLAAGQGSDTVTGGAGDDTMGGSLGTDTVIGGDGNDSLGGGAGRDTISAGAGNDLVGGGEGDDTISGGTGNDFLAGGGRDDFISGGAGNDTINSGPGNDTIEGNTGADVFVWLEGEPGETDIVRGFEDGLDSFRLSDVPNAPGSGLQGRVDSLDIVDTVVEGGFGVSMSYQGQTILVSGVTAAQLGVEDFLFL